MTENIGALDVPAPHLGPDKTSVREVRDILGVNIRVASRADVFADIERTIMNGEHQKYAFFNAHGANISFKNEEYCSVLKGFSVLSDGIGIDIASRMLYGPKFPDNLNGTDFIPGLLGFLKDGVHVGLLGAQEGVAKEAAANFSKRFPHHRFSVVSDGYFDDAKQKRILTKLKKNPPDILMVAFGNPRQEMWIAEYCTEEHAKVAIGVGALFDFVASRVPRAPKLMRQLRFEWLYRLWLEPNRLWRRYVLGNPAFLLRVLRQKFSGKSR